MATEKATKAKSHGLGRGLDTLLGSAGATDRSGRRVPIAKIDPNPSQPRRSFDEAGLKELAASIAERGIIQPLVVRPSPKGESKYEIVAGERRWRAAQMARLHEVPVMILTLDDREALEAAIVENVQREDLNPLEEAEGYNQLIEKFGHNQKKLSEILGKSPSYISNSLRLLTLPEEVKGYLREGKLSTSHARTLVSVQNPSAVAREVISGGLSVRETEELAKKSQPKPKGRSGRKALAKDADTRALEQDMSADLKMKVVINHRPDKGGGRISFVYDSIKQLDDLIGRLMPGANDED